MRTLPRAVASTAVKSTTVKPAADKVAGEIRLAAVVVLIQAAGLLAGALFIGVQTALGHADDIGRALSDAGFALGGAVLLAALARAVGRLVAAARTPLVVLEVLALPIGYSLAFPSHRAGWGAVVLVSALAVLGLLLTPAARAQLQR